MPITLPPPLTPVGQVICTVAGAYSFLGTKATTSALMANNELRAVAVTVPEPVTLDRIGCEITAAGNAGAVVRLGLYADNGSPYPGALVLDAGTVAADSTGVKEITISQTLAAGIYWLCSAVQSAATTLPTIRIPDERIGICYASTAASAANLGIVLQGSVSGALPAAFSSSLSIGSQVARIFVRVT